MDGKVCDLFREGLRLRDISFRKAIRKDRNDNKPGVIIVTCETMEDKTRIMRVKKELKNSRKYDKVYIHNDQSVETRVNNNNLKVLISALGVSGVKLRGSRLVMEEDDSHTIRDRSNTDGNSYGRNHSERSNQNGYSSGYRYRNEQRSRDRENEERHDRQGERKRDRRNDGWDDRRNNRRDERDDRGDFFIARAQWHEMVILELMKAATYIRGVDGTAQKGTDKKDDLIFQGEQGTEVKVEPVEIEIPNRSNKGFGM